MSTRAEYDELPYDDFPFQETQPAHLFVLAALLGLPAPPPDACRVLELGCGRGGNLLPMAATLPGCHFTGVDLSSMHIAVARDDVEALGLSNIDVHVADIRDLDASLGAFDYIVCHGVYSWVPDDVQHHILRVCRELLAPEGVAYVSYNTLPGWHLRGLVRDVLLREAGTTAPVDIRIGRARELLALLSHLPQTGAGGWVRGEVDLLAGMSDAYLRYEHLAEHNHPVYFRDLALRAARAGLAYVTDAHDWARSTDRLAPEARAWIDRRSRNLLDTEHYLDLIETRFFRRSLFCHKERPVDRRIDPARLHGLWLAADLTADPSAPPLTSEADETFSGQGDVTLTAAPPLLRAALRVLAATPRGLSFPDLASAARALLDAATAGEGAGLDASTLPEASSAGLDAPSLPSASRAGASGSPAGATHAGPSAEPRGQPSSGGAHSHAPPTAEDLELLGGNLLGLATQGVIELSPGPRPYSPVPGDRPATTSVARRQAASGAPGCTSLRHRRIAVDSMDRSLLARMNGERDRADLTRGVLDDIAAGLVSIEVDGEKVTDPASIEELVRQKLDHLAARAFVLP